MTATATTPTSFVGCDVGKRTIVVYTSFDDRTCELDNTAAALAAWAATLPADCLVVCEATGGYEAELLAALLAADRQIHRADARKVKAFIRSFGTLAKTDRIDARALADYGRERHPRLARWRAREPSHLALQAMVRTRSDLVAERTACRNRLQAPGAAHVRAFLEPLLACLDEQIAAIDAAVSDALSKTRALQAQLATLRTISGIGPTIAAALIALVPELGTTHRRHIAALCGLAPHPRQSGARDAHRSVRGGRNEVKRLLFMAALAATRRNGPLKVTYDRLRDNGKKPLVALTAVMRKIIVIANARLRDWYQLNNQQPLQLS